MCYFWPWWPNSYDRVQAHIFPRNFTFPIKMVEIEIPYLEALCFHYNQISPFSYSIMIITNSNQLHYHLYEFMEDKMCFRKLKSMILLHK